MILHGDDLDAEVGDAGATAGCMGGMFRYLDFHHRLFSGCRTPQSPPREFAAFHREAVLTFSPRSSAGIEAPRNSLELDAGRATATVKRGSSEVDDVSLSSSSSLRSMSFSAVAPSSEVGTPRTPSLVARLMGFDGLPEQQASFSPVKACCRKENRAEKKTKVDQNRGARVERKKEGRPPLRTIHCSTVVSPFDVGLRSPPSEPPRPSTTAKVGELLGRRPALVHIYKENPCGDVPESSTPLPKKVPVKQQKNTSEAREIVRLAMENVTSRRAAAGAGLTAAHSKTTMVVAGEDDSGSKERFNSGATAAQAPALPVGRLEDHIPHLRSSQAASPPMTQVPVMTTHSPANCIYSSDRSATSPTGSRRTAPPFNASGVAVDRFETRLTVRQLHPPPSPSSTKQRIAANRPEATVDSNRVQDDEVLLTCSRGDHQYLPQEREAAEYNYVRLVLERASAFAVDPIIFHLLEFDVVSSATAAWPWHRWNRKLLFDLSREILADLNGRRDNQQFHGERLLRQVWRGILSFPAANCRLLGDVDALVGGDISLSDVRLPVQHHRVVAGEAEIVAAALERWILDGLLGEVAAVLVGAVG